MSSDIDRKQPYFAVVKMKIPIVAKDREDAEAFALEALQAEVSNWGKGPADRQLEVEEVTGQKDCPMGRNFLFRLPWGGDGEHTMFEYFDGEEL